VAFCLGRPGRPGLVEVPLGDRTPAEVAMWGVLTGESPDEIVVDVDEERGMLVVHLVDAGDPDAIRARHAHTHARWRGTEGG
jgi:multisubunit Na+/H+ antiporter MnhE subunit